MVYPDTKWLSSPWMQMRAAKEKRSKVLRRYTGREAMQPHSAACGEGFQPLCNQVQGTGLRASTRHSSCQLQAAAQTLCEIFLPVTEEPLQLHGHFLVFFHVLFIDNGKGLRCLFIKREQAGDHVHGQPPKLHQECIGLTLGKSLVVLSKRVEEQVWNLCCRIVRDVIQFKAAVLCEDDSLSIKIELIDISGVVIGDSHWLDSLNLVCCVAHSEYLLVLFLLGRVCRRLFCHRRCAGRGNIQRGLCHSANSRLVQAEGRRGAGEEGGLRKLRMHDRKPHSFTSLSGSIVCRQERFPERYQIVR
nr:MAG TPA: hypothetical protein [Caudoviricetes sp.]